MKVGRILLTAGVPSCCWVAATAAVFPHTVGGVRH